MRTESQTDHYGVLGLTPGASEEEIRLQYRRLAKVYHPDRNNNDAWCREQITRINLAYGALLAGGHAGPPPAAAARADRADRQADAGQDSASDGFVRMSVLPLVCLGLCLAAYGAVVLKALASCLAHPPFHGLRP